MNAFSRGSLTSTSPEARESRTSEWKCFAVGFAAAAFTKAAGNINFKNAIRLEAAAAAARLLAPADANGAGAILAKAAKLSADSQSAAQYLSAVKAMQLALENGELGPKPKAGTPKAK